MAKKTKSQLKLLQLEFEQLERERKKRSRGKSVIFHTGRAGEILNEIEQIREERREKASGTREYKYLQAAIERMQKAGRTMLELPEVMPKTLTEKKRLTEIMKEELRNIAAETREEAKNARSLAEKKRLEVKAMLDESWGPERDRMIKTLEEYHKNPEDSAAQRKYRPLWKESDLAIRQEEPEPEPFEPEPEEESDLDWVEDDEIIF